MLELVKACGKCKRELLINCFYKDKSKKDGLSYWCKECRQKSSKNYYETHKEQLSKWQKEYNKAHKERRKKYNAEHLEENARDTRNSLARLKLKALQHLNDELKCKNCTIDDIRILSMDHIYNDGSKEHKRLGHAKICRNVLKMTQKEAQQRYQVLCWNCNWIKFIETKPEWKPNPYWLDAITQLGKLQCLHCSNSDIRVLVIDHIQNDGGQERLEITNHKIWRKIAKMSESVAQEQYQILCRNCNWLKELESR